MITHSVHACSIDSVDLSVWLVVASLMQKAMKQVFDVEKDVHNASFGWITLPDVDRVRVTLDAAGRPQASALRAVGAGGSDSSAWSHQRGKSSSARWLAKERSQSVADASRARGSNDGGGRVADAGRGGDTVIEVNGVKLAVEAGAAVEVRNGVVRVISAGANAGEWRRGWEEQGEWRQGWESKGDWRRGWEDKEEGSEWKKGRWSEWAGQGWKAESSAGQGGKA